MSTPTMKGFTTLVPYEYSEILDTSDSRAFNLGVVEPGGSVTNYYAWWYNLGYAYLYNGQLSLVVGGTLDYGADADTIDVMNIGAPYTLNWLNHTIPATPDNTSGWTYPMQDPFRPFLDRFIGGIKWDPPIGATTGIIHKCFQWDGSYHPDTWDFVYYPMANGYCLDSTYLEHPFHSSISNALEFVQTDATADSGYELKVMHTSPSAGYLYYAHDQAGDPWYDSVDNAVGYNIKISAKVKDIAIIDGGDGLLIIRVDDGAYHYDIHIYRNYIAGGSGADGFSVAWTDLSLDMYSSHVEIDIRVQGTAFELDLDGVNKITATLSYPTATKSLGLRTGAALAWAYEINYIKYYLAGTTSPIT